VKVDLKPWLKLRFNGRLEEHGSEWASRFWSKVRLDSRSRCWLWTAAVTKGGYGKFSVRRSTWAFAHRVSWSLARGPVKKGLFVCHKCDNPSCVRPTHLFLGTQRDNLRDMSAKGRSSAPARKLSDGEVRLIRRLITATRPKVNRDDLAHLYSVDRRTIDRIARGDTWRHV